MSVCVGERTDEYDSSSKRKGRRGWASLAERDIEFVVRVKGNLKFLGLGCQSAEEIAQR